MKTKKALSILSKGDRNYGDALTGPLAKSAQRFIEQYDNREKAIIAKKNQDTVLKPFVDAIKRKVAKVASEQDRAMPLAMRFDVHQVVKRAAAQLPGDRGLQHFAGLVENLWHQDPMGSITLGQLMDLRAHYKDTFPKSKVAKIIDTEIPKVGYNKLPVAKLAKLASKINDQADFDEMIVMAGLAGDKPEQVRARTLVRELVALKGTAVDSHEKAAADERTNHERVTDRIAQEIGLNDELPPGVAGPGGDDDMALEPELSDIPPEFSPVDEGVPGELPGEEAGGEAVSDMVDTMEEVQQFVEDTAPPEATPYIELERQETSTPENPEGAVPGTAEWGFAEAEEGHSAPPPSKEWQMEELEEHGIEPGGAPMDIDVGLDDAPIDDGLDAPPVDDFLEQNEAMRAASYKLPLSKCGSAPAGWEYTVEEMKSYDEIDNPVALAHWMYEQGFAPLAEQSGDAAMNPGKPKTQPKVTTYAPDRSMDGGKELTKDETKKASIPFTAEEIEQRILDNGEVVKVGSVSIHINDQDAVELWVKDAGRECDLQHIDTAIADFIKYASEELNPNPDKRGGFYFVRLVPVPCAKCATVSLFEPVMDKKAGLYACDCGHRTMASVVDTMVKHGQLQENTVLKLRLPAKFANDEKAIKGAIQNLVKNVVKPVAKHAKVEHVAGRDVDIMVSASNERVEKALAVELKRAGIVPVTAQFGDPSGVSAPGSADMPVVQESTTIKAPAGTPAANSENPDNHQDLTEDGIRAAFTHYHAMGLNYLEAFKEFTKDYAEAIENHFSPEMQAAVIGISQELFTGGAAAPAPAAPPVAPEGGEEIAPAAPAAPAGNPISAALVAQAKKILRQAFSTPKVNQQQPDAVKVEKQPLGKEKDNDTGHPGSLKQPAVKVKHPASQKSPTDMGSTNEDNHPSGLSAPKPPKDGHVPGKAGDQPGTKAPSKGLNGKDSDHNGKSIPVPGKFGPRPKA